MASEIEASAAAARTVVDVRFRIPGRARAHDAGALELGAHDLVVVETGGGPELGEVIREPRPLWPEERGAKLPRVLRIADEDDLRRAGHNRRQERRARAVFLEAIARLGVPAKLIRVDYRFDGGKAVFYFLAEKRIEFRSLGRELAQALHTRVEMRQIGDRDETRLVGGIGPCGRELCCSSWMRSFEAVSIKMAKAQGLSLSPSKLAGMCGRLKCCLRYEYETYLALRRELPRVGARVQTVKGDGKVIEQIPLRGQVRVRRSEDDVVVECGLEDLVAKRPEADG